MAGTKEGGKLAAATMKRKYGSNFYKKIGELGGSAGHTGGFYARRDVAVSAGAKGGRLSKKGWRFAGYDEEGSPFWVKKEN